MKKIALLAWLFSVGAFAQVETYSKNYSSKDTENKNNLFSVNKQDSITIDGHLYFFKQSPITYLNDYHLIVCKAPVVLPRIHSGYTTRWTVKENQLFISDIHTYPAFCNSKSNFQKVEKKIAKEKLSKFTKSQYDKNGLLPTKWVDGKFLLYKYPLSLNREWTAKKDLASYEKNKEYRLRIAKDQEVYSVSFKSGKLVCFNREYDLEKKLKEQLIH